MLEKKILCFEMVFYVTRNRHSRKKSEFGEWLKKYLSLNKSSVPNDDALDKGLCRFTKLQKKIAILFLHA